VNEFKYKMDGEYIIECDSCGMEAPISHFNANLPGKKERDLCELCAGSFIANATEYTQLYDNVALYQSIAMVGNILLDKLTDRRKELEKNKNG
jgi:hypothetical protein